MNKRHFKWYFTLMALIVCVMVVLGCQANSPTATKTASPAISQAPTISTATVPAATSAAAPPAAVTTTAASPKPASQAPSATPASGGTITWLDANAPGSPLGIPWESKITLPSQQPVLESFLDGMSDGTLIPRLAESYEVNADPKDPFFLFHLRKGVKFQDGTDFNAKAAKWNLEKFQAGGLWASTRYYKSFDVIDDYTLKVPLTEWRNSIIPAWYTYPIISPTAFDKQGIDALRWNMIGTGPFKQVQFNRDVSLTTTRNEDYWNKGKPYFSGVQYLWVAEEMTRTVLFKTGGADILNANKSGRIANDLQTEGYKIIPQTAATSALFPDSANVNSPWANLKLRQAAEYAIDKEAIAKAFGFGYSKAAYQAPNSDSMAYNPAITGRKYDPAKARQLLTEAGYPNGFKTKIIAQNTVNRDIVVAIQSYLNAVGIQTDLEFPEPAKFVSYQQGTYDNALMYSTAPGGGAWPNQGFGAGFPIPRVTMKSNKNPDNWPALYDKTMHTPTQDPKVIQECIMALYEDVTFIPINYEYDLIALKTNVQDTGIGTHVQATTWDPQSAWFSK